MEKSKILSMLGLARRAGKLSMGHDVAAESIRSGKAELLLLCCDLSERAVRDMQFIAGKYDPKLTVFGFADISTAEIYSSCGYRAGIITVNDENFARKIISLTGK